MSRLTGTLSTLAVLSLALPGTALAQNHRTVYATVLDGEGALVGTLSAPDFVVREDGVSREVLRASRADEPLQIALLVDTSQAAARYVQDVREAARSFVRRLGEKHEIAIVEFGDRPWVLTEYTRDVTALERGVNRLFARRGSAAYALDAIVEASKDLRRREGSRHAIVLVSTEGPDFSDRYHRQVLDELRPSATLHAFVLTRRAGPGLDDGRRERDLTISRGSVETGGRREYLLTSMALKDRLLSLAEELENQYRIDYARGDALVPPEKIEVSVKAPGLTVRAPRAIAALRPRS